MPEQPATADGSPRQTMSPGAAAGLFHGAGGPAGGSGQRQSPESEPEDAGEEESANVVLTPVTDPVMQSAPAREREGDAVTQAPAANNEGEATQPESRKQARSATDTGHASEPALEGWMRNWAISGKTGWRPWTTAAGFCRLRSQAKRPMPVGCWISWREKGLIIGPSGTGNPFGWCWRGLFQSSGRRWMQSRRCLQSCASGAFSPQDGRHSQRVVGPENKNGLGDCSICRPTPQCVECISLFCRHHYPDAICLL